MGCGAVLTSTLLLSIYCTVLYSLALTSQLVVVILKEAMAVQQACHEQYVTAKKRSVLQMTNSHDEIANYW
jgi:hypothetical protein